MLHRSKQSTSGYARIAQAEEEEDEDAYHDDPEDDSYAPQRTLSNNDPQYAPLQPGRRPPMQPYSASYKTPSQKRKRRNRSTSAVDVKAINARLEKWADEIAHRFKLRKVKGKTHDEEKLEIHHSVFVAPDDIRPASSEALTASFLEQPEDRMTKLQFDDVVESVRVAIELGTHPKMITQGSSGSYFARNSSGKTVGVFKPKDEEPYASRNPKWTKWIHRNLFPFAFGRACLIPNLSYISEAAACLLDSRLQTNIVPYTDIVYLSSISFNNDYWDRRAYYRKRKQLPPKVGSFQVFLKGYQDATLFLKDHPWPDQQSTSLRAPSNPRGKRKKRWAESCRPTKSAIDEDDEDDSSVDPSGGESQKRKTFWSDELQLSFREQLEKLVILDYIMRNTDRGLDNWMVRIDEETQTASIVAKPPKSAKDSDAQPLGSTTPSSPIDSTNVSLGAIDNSLSWPWKHPDAWRSFPFGWLFLPVSLIGQPFTQRTREHFLPLLTSKQWWSDTQIALRRCFEQDSDFKERMFARQIAVMKGQAWNVVETLKTPQHGPLELTRRAKVCVWDDLVDVPVVIPLRASSDSFRPKEEGDAYDHSTPALQSQTSAPPPRRTSPHFDESDLSAPHIPNSAPPEPHAANGNLSLSSEATEIPSSTRFNHSRDSSADDLSRPKSNSTSKDFELTSPDHGGSKAADRLRISLQSARNLSRNSGRPGVPRSRTRVSYEEPRLNALASSARRKRHFSFSARRLSIESEEDGGGDLGFTAARDMEGLRKKVIVERLETVKSKGPVFTWC